MCHNATRCPWQPYWLRSHEWNDGSGSQSSSEQRQESLSFQAAGQQQLSRSVRSSLPAVPSPSSSCGRHRAAPESSRCVLLSGRVLAAAPLPRAAPARQATVTGDRSTRPAAEPKPLPLSLLPPSWPSRTVRCFERFAGAARGTACWTSFMSGSGFDRDRLQVAASRTSRARTGTRASVSGCSTESLRDANGSTSACAIGSTDSSGSSISAQGLGVSETKGIRSAFSAITRSERVWGKSALGSLSSR